ncbi:MAG: type II toxin-antitoxin system HicA family toxin [Candidatus Diapherotrites archaeon]
MKLSPLKTGKLLRLLVELGFEEQRQTGSHKTFLHPDGRRTVVPVHANEDIGTNLLSKILKQINLRREEFEKMRSKL